MNAYKVVCSLRQRSQFCTDLCPLSIPAAWPWRAAGFGKGCIWFDLILLRITSFTLSSLTQHWFHLGCAQLPAEAARGRLGRTPDSSR